MEEAEEKAESDGNTNAQMDSGPVLNSSPEVNRDNEKATQSTPKTIDSTTSTSSTFVSDDETSVVTSFSNAQRRIIFGARVAKKYVRRSVAVPISM